jgi:cytochrome c-type biogenesis protein CcmH/NrfF
MPQRLNALGLLVALLLALVAPAAAQPAAPAPWGGELANELMSPWCPGFALPDCTSGYAKQLHAWILEQERLGRPRAEVEAEVLARYGEKILQAPKAEGRAWFAYLVPAFAGLAGLLVLVAFLRRQVEAPAVALASDPSREAQLAARVDAELAARERTHPSA